MTTTPDHIIDSVGKHARPQACPPDDHLLAAAEQAADDAVQSVQAKFESAAWLQQQQLRARERRDAERLEDLEWMASTGETTEGAAQRLGIGKNGLAKALTRLERQDLWERLRENERRRHGGWTLADVHRHEATEAARDASRGRRRKVA